MVATGSCAYLSGNGNVQAVVVGLCGCRQAMVVMLIGRRCRARVATVLWQSRLQFGVAMSVGTDAPDEPESTARAGQQAEEQGTQ